MGAKAILSFEMFPTNVAVVTSRCKMGLQVFSNVIFLWGAVNIVYKCVKNLNPPISSQGQSSTACRTSWEALEDVSPINIAAQALVAGVVAGETAVAAVSQAAVHQQLLLVLWVITPACTPTSSINISSHNIGS